MLEEMEFDEEEELDPNEPTGWTPSINGWKYPMFISEDDPEVEIVAGLPEWLYIGRAYIDGEPQEWIFRIISLEDEGEYFGFQFSDEFEYYDIREGLRELKNRLKETQKTLSL